MRSIGIAVLVVVLATGCVGGDDGESAPAPAATATSPSGTFAVYELEGDGFALSVPDTWTALRADALQGESEQLDSFAEENPDLAPFIEMMRSPNSPMKFMAVAPAIEDGFATNVNVVSVEVPTGMSVDAFTRANLEQARALAVNEDVSHDTVDLPAGEGARLAYEVDLNRAGERQRLFYVQYLVVDGRTGYVVTYTTLPGLEGKYADVFETSIGSFRFL